MSRPARCFTGFLTAALSFAAHAGAQSAQPEQPQSAAAHAGAQSAQPEQPQSAAAQSADVNVDARVDSRDKPADAPPLPPASRRKVSLTLSPLHLQFPLFEFMAEVRLFAMKHHAVSAVFIAGYGEVPQAVEKQNGLQSDTLSPTAGHLGGQLIYYPLEDFRSLQIGAEVMLVKYLGFELEKGQYITTVGDGLAVGPFIGYKYLDKSGFTASGQLGLDYMVQRLHAPPAGTKISSGTPSNWFPLANVNVGWSF